MQFGMVYTLRNTTEANDRRLLNLFTNWTPPQGFEFKSHHEFGDGTGGMAIVEVSSPEAMYEATAPFRDFVDFKLSPVVEISVAVPLVLKAQAWANSVS